MQYTVKRRLRRAASISVASTTRDRDIVNRFCSIVGQPERKVAAHHDSCGAQSWAAHANQPLTVPSRTNGSPFGAILLRPCTAFFRYCCPVSTNRCLYSSKSLWKSVAFSVLR